jgi:putative protease
MKRPELLSPAGDMESLTAAAEFGADAVYIGGSSFSMRSAPANFTMPQIRAAASYLHGCGKKLYVACNVLPRNDELGDIEAFLYNAAQAGADAFIISDMGVLELAKKTAPQVDIHISTQTGVVNYAAANALFSYGAKRIVLAREVSLREIAQIRAHIPASLELEAFIHGSMCVSFSGRCLLSNYLAARDGNHGECAQPCRWNYALCEETRPGEYMPISEDGTGTHILSSKDLRMIEHIPEMLAAGISSLKIEGRAKSACYTAAVTNAYRMAVDSYLETGCEAPDPQNHRRNGPCQPPGILHRLLFRPD